MSDLFIGFNIGAHFTLLGFSAAENNLSGVVASIVIILFFVFAVVTRKVK